MVLIRNVHICSDKKQYEIIFFVINNIVMLEKLNRTILLR